MSLRNWRRGRGVGGRTGFRLGLGKGAAFRFRRSRLGLGVRTVRRALLGGLKRTGCAGRTRLGWNWTGLIPLGLQRSGGPSSKGGG